MTTPEVHELPRKLEPMTPDTFLAGIEPRTAIVRPGWTSIGDGHKRSIGGVS
jgi:hypothetical protein